VKLRSARAGEEDALARLANDAFRLDDLEGWQRWFRDHSGRAPADTIVAEDTGRVLGQATALRLTMRWRGRDLPFRGIAAVGVAPEARRRGVAGRVLGEIHRRMRARGEPLALLYPFSVPFYQRLGYGVVEWPEIVRAPPAALPAAAERRHVRRFDLERDQAAVRAVYDQVYARSCGFVARDDYWWRERVFARVPERVVYDDGAVRGYLLYDVPAQPAYPRQHVLVKELVAATDCARRGLVGFLEALGEQFAQVELVVPCGTGATLARQPALVTRDDVTLYFPACAVVSGTMARLVDVPRALTLLDPSGVRGRLGLDVTEPGVARAQHFDVEVAAGRVRARPGTRARDRLALPLAHLSQVFFAAARAEVLLGHGHIAGSPRAAALLDAACAGPPLFLSRLNFF
jgi:predicted acetyltransferase